MYTAMTYHPTALDHDEAVRLHGDPRLTEADRAACVIVALAAKVGKPITRETHAAFDAIMRRTAAT